MELEFETPRLAIGAFRVLIDRGIAAVYLPDAAKPGASPDETQLTIATVRVPAEFALRSRAILAEHGIAARGRRAAKEGDWESAPPLGPN